MKTLLLLRHAKSSWNDPDLADHDRPLNKRGRGDAPRMGQLLRHNNIVPELILTSTAKRARKTARRVADSAFYKGPIEEIGDLYLAGVGTFIQVLNGIGSEHQSVLLVGHNPGIEDLLEMLTGTFEVLPTAALAHLNVPVEKWVEVSTETQGELLNLWRPRELP